MKKNIFLLSVVLIITFFILCCNSPEVNKHSLVKKWETDSVFKTPESVLFDKVNNLLYVSNIDGKDVWAADGKGSIGKMGADGKNIIVDWVTGLNGPKGMGLYKGKLYVADPATIIVIDIQSGTIIKKIPITGAKGLNDIAIDQNGVLYVSDSEDGKVYKLKGDSIELFLENLKAPNGLLLCAGDLFMLASGAFYKVNADKSLLKIAGGMNGADGMENVTGKDFIVSASGGVPYYVYEDGKKEKLSDGKSKEITSADIGYDAAARTLFVPTFDRNTVAAYEIK